MNEDTAMARLSSMVAADKEPILDSEKLMALLDISAVPDIYGTPICNKASVALYANTTAYEAGDMVRTGEYRFWQALTRGTSGSTTFPALLGPLVGTPYHWRDGDILWLDAGPLWIPSWSLNKAAAEGWRWKAGQLSEQFDFASDNQQFSARQQMGNCLNMAALYDKKTGGTFRVNPNSDYKDLTGIYLLAGSA